VAIYNYHCNYCVINTFHNSLSKAAVIKQNFFQSHPYTPDFKKSLRNKVINVHSAEVHLSYIIWSTVDWYHISIS